MSEFGARIRAARAYADLSQGDLADAIGLGERTLRDIERGVREPRPFEKTAMIDAVADACGLPRAFFGGDFEEEFRLADERRAQLIDEAEDDLAADYDLLPLTRRMGALLLKDLLRPVVERLDEIAAAVGVEPPAATGDHLEDAAKAAEELPSRRPGEAKDEAV